MQIKPYYLGTVALVAMLSSCAKHNNLSITQTPVQTAIVAPCEALPATSTALAANQTPEIPPLYASSDVNIVTLEAASKGTKYEKTVAKLKDVLQQVERAKQEQSQVNQQHKMNFAEKLVVKKLEKQYKKASNQAASGFHSWNSFLKVGVILLGIGIILTILGLGAIGGLSALIGLIFTVIGLLAEF